MNDHLQYKLGLFHWIAAHEPTFVDTITSWPNIEVTPEKFPELDEFLGLACCRKCDEKYLYFDYPHTVTNDSEQSTATNDTNHAVNGSAEDYKEILHAIGDLVCASNSYSQDQDPARLDLNSKKLDLPHDTPGTPKGRSNVPEQVEIGSPWKKIGIPFRDSAHSVSSEAARRRMLRITSSEMNAKHF